MKHFFYRRDCKKQARKSLRGHYLRYVFLCLVAAVIGTAYTPSYLELTEAIKAVIPGGEDVQNANTRWQLNEVLTEAIEGGGNLERIADDMINSEQDEESEYVGGHIEIGHYNGVFAQIRNRLTSGAFIVLAFSALASVLGSSKAILALVLIAFALVFATWVFFINVYNVIIARMFLEGRIYEKVPIQRFAYLIYVRKWGKAALTMLLKEIFFTLWCLTVVGGVIKYYSYFAVPYIVAENPALPARKVICLSRDMMQGHKWECFVLHLSFLGWNVLDIITFGASGILFSNPYKEAAKSEYYVYIRKCAKDLRMSGVDELEDVYLYIPPSQGKLAELYQDEVYAKLLFYEVEEEYRKRSIRTMLSDFFGICLNNKARWEENSMRREKDRIERKKYIIAGKEYGYKLLPIPDKQRRNMFENLEFVRKYSVWTLFLFFICFSMIGWLWEVSLHLMKDGGFINRGILHGPWLPVYGTGAVFILLALNKLRSKPFAEFLGAMLLCGLIEYASGFILEKLHQGQKWWDYSGYFVNVDGRVCAEGLLVFGMGGMVVVYLLAPLFDNMVKRIQKRTIIILCIVFLVLFGSDLVYSSFFPNVGEGITSASCEETNEKIVGEIRCDCI